MPSPYRLAVKHWSFFLHKTTSSDSKLLAEGKHNLIKEKLRKKYT